jgi:hypothetical protein
MGLAGNVPGGALGVRPRSWMDGTVELLVSKARTTFSHDNNAMRNFCGIPSTLCMHHVRLPAATDNVMDWPILHVHEGGYDRGKKGSAGVCAKQSASEGISLASATNEIGTVFRKKWNLGVLFANIWSSRYASWDLLLTRHWSKCNETSQSGQIEIVPRVNHLQKF